jgi:hypothetical protein
LAFTDARASEAPCVVVVTLCVEAVEVVTHDPFTHCDVNCDDWWEV